MLVMLAVAAPSLARRPADAHDARRCWPFTWGHPQLMLVMLAVAGDAQLRLMMLAAAGPCMGAPAADARDARRCRVPGATPSWCS